MLFNCRGIDTEGSSKERSNGGAATHDTGRWLSVQDMLYTIDPEEHCQQGARIIERIYDRQDV